MFININLIYQLNWYINISFYNYWFGYVILNAPPPQKHVLWKAKM